MIGRRKRSMPWLAGLGLLLVVGTGAVVKVLASEQQRPIDAILERIFVKNEFREKRTGPVHWIREGAAYMALEPSSANKQARDIVEYDTATGRRTLLVPAEKLVPPGASKPLDIEGEEWSKDLKRLLIFTNSQRVWRANTRGDYWVLDLDSGKLTKLGGDAPASSLEFAHFSPDATKVAYVHENNLYVQTLPSGAPVALTRDGSATIINGTTDWVYEEEFFLRDAFRWSPDGRSVAYWQFDTSGVDN